MFGPAKGINSLRPKEAETRRRRRSRRRRGRSSTVPSSSLGGGGGLEIEAGVARNQQHLALGAQPALSLNPYSSAVIGTS